MSIDVTRFTRVTALRAEFIFTHTLYLSIMTRRLRRVQRWQAGLDGRAPWTPKERERTCAPPPASRFHAILAACLAGLAASSAAAAKPQIDNEGHAYLTITLMGPHGTSQGPQLEVHGFTWGPRQSALKLDRNYVPSWSTAAMRPVPIRKATVTGSRMLSGPRPGAVATTNSAGWYRWQGEGAARPFHARRLGAGYRRRRAN